MAGSEPAQKTRLGKMDETDERRLVEAAQQDRACFADVYERYFELVYAYVARRVRERAATEDLTSEVFRKALANIQRFKWTGAPFGAWLLRIASRAVADHWKRSGREYGEPSPEACQAESYEVERRAMLFQLVDRLPEAQFRVIHMRFVEQKSIREIAQEMGRSEGAVKQLQLRAVENLRAQMEGAHG